MCGVSEMVSFGFEFHELVVDYYVKKWSEFLIGKVNIVSKFLIPIVNNDLHTGPCSAAGYR